MRESLAVQLEQLSYYHHQALTGGTERPIHAFRSIDVRGTRYYVLSQIQDAGLDFTKRTNFLAQHLIFTPEEVSEYATPPLLFLYWTGWEGWKQTWDGEPKLLSDDDWGNLATIKAFERDPTRAYETAPARFWKELTGSGVNAFGLLDLRNSISLGTDNLPEQTLLHLFAESLRMLELHSPNADYTASAWEFMFTTNLQAQDNPNDFKWRCVPSAASNGEPKATSACAAPIQEVCSKAHTLEESNFAEFGPQPAVIIGVTPETTADEGQFIQLEIKAGGIPYPTIEWFWNGKVLQGFSGPKCEIKNLKPGHGQFCEVRVRNAYNQVSTRIMVHVNQAPKPLPEKVAPFRWDGPDPNTANTPQLVSLVHFYKNDGKRLWECIRILDESAKHQPLLDVDPSELKRLHEFCINQKETPAKRIAARCASKLGCWFRITIFVRANLWISIVGLTLVLLSLGLLVWKTWPFIERYLEPKRKQSEPFNSLQNQGDEDKARNRKK